ncbi:hypothetical protein [Helicobacter sp. 13S00477-4]|uniref:hypothetical protein n=1 Tax=Helicobacter sp. 13S00477-4 TaxID=1905759 RepID=UPI000BA79A5E|nr:hypothetical protein [Helicobacter sp. 13S00477-4]PAF50445.1 hypothetical protein BKH44_08230 [Helicobacter sp. 13S00477-4]
MKISIMCQSLLLQESLKYYLKDIDSDVEECDFIISDTLIDSNKPICLIGDSSNSDIKKPFNQTRLFKDINNFYHSKIKASTIIANPMPDFLNIKNPELKMQIDSILEEFSRKIYQTLKNHNE